MSLSSSDTINRKMFHHRKGTSKELEVVEAAQYFSSDYNEASAMNIFGANFSQKVKKKDKGWIKGRISLDMQVKNILNLPQHSYSVEKQVTKEKKYKQPSSPGGRLASFLNSIFSNSSSKKKKSKHFSQSMEDIEDESQTLKRSISISHFRSSNATATDAKFMYSSSSPRNSDFRTQPQHVQTPTKSYKELLSFPKFNRRVKSAEALQKAAMEDKRTRKDNQDSCLEEKWKLRDGVVEKQKMNNLKTCSTDKKNRVWVEKLVAEEMKLRELDDIYINDDEDDGGESDSSSDLFELQIYDLDYYSNGLPVYESTDIDSIKRRNSVSNAVC